MFFTPNETFFIVVQNWDNTFSISQEVHRKVNILSNHKPFEHSNFKSLANISLAYCFIIKCINKEN